jgi:hypothetical protein
MHRDARIRATFLPLESRASRDAAGWLDLSDSDGLET